MRGVLKWVGIVLGGLLALMVVLAVLVYVQSESIQNQKYETPAVSLTVPTDAAAIERGRHMVTVVSDCTGCHGADLSGTYVLDDPAIGRLLAPNLTNGAGGFGTVLTDEDIARVLRYGVLPDGKSVRVMPADDYTHLTDADLGAMIAYIRSVPAVDTDHAPTALGPVGRALLVSGQLPIMVAPRIDFASAGSPPVAMGPTHEYGAYLINVAGCAGCHGQGLSGGLIPGGPPGFPEAANLTPSGEVGTWTEEDFINTIRTGVNPAGRELAPEMPWMTYRNMTDEELQALWAYIASVPAKEAGTR
jgi:mono/diheme cytochrome c family protein